MTDFGRALINIYIVQGQRDKEKQIPPPVQRARAPLPKNYDENPDVPVNPIEDKYNSVGDMLDKYLMKVVKIPIAKTGRSLKMPDGKKRKKKKKKKLNLFELALMQKYKKGEKNVTVST